MFWKEKMMKYRSFPGGILFLAIISFFVVALPVLVSADDIICDFTDFARGDLIIDGFELKNKTDISIEAVGAEFKHSDYMFAYGWIIDANTREPLWILADEDTKRYKKSRILREYSDEISLPASRYEVIYFVGESAYINGGNIIINNFDDAGNILEAIFGGNDDYDDDDIYIFEDDYDDFYDVIGCIDGLEHIAVGGEFAVAVLPVFALAFDAGDDFPDVLCGTSNFRGCQPVGRSDRRRQHVGVVELQHRARHR